MPESSELYTTRERESFALRKVSWGAIFSGVALFLVIQFTLSVLGAAVGLTTLNPAQEAEPAAGLGMGAAIWWIVSMILALFVAGWAASKLSVAWSKMSGALHGLVTWAVSVVLLLWLLTSAVGSVLGGALSSLQVQASSIGQIAPQIQQKAQQMTGQNGDAQQMQNGDGQMPQNGEQVAQTAADVSATAAWGSFITLILGAIAAAIGGGIGTPKRGVYVTGTYGTEHKKREEPQ